MGQTNCMFIYVMIWHLCGWDVGFLPTCSAEFFAVLIVKRQLARNFASAKIKS